MIQISPSAVWLWCHPHQLVDCSHLTSFPKSMCRRFLFLFLQSWKGTRSIFLPLSSVSWQHSSIAAWFVSTSSMHLLGCLHESPSLWVLVEDVLFFFTLTSLAAVSDQPMISTNNNSSSLIVLLPLLVPCKIMMEIVILI